MQLGDYNGWIDEFRISKGIQRHPGYVDFSPPDPLRPPQPGYSTDAYTILLLHFDPDTYVHVGGSVAATLSNVIDSSKGGTPTPLKTVSHHNYICTIKPMKLLWNITGTISNLNNNTIVTDNNGRIIFNFIIIPL